MDYNDFSGLLRNIVVPMLRLLGIKFGFSGQVWEFNARPIIAFNFEESPSQNHAYFLLVSSLKVTQKGSYVSGALGCY